MRNSLRQQLTTNYHHKMLHPRCGQGPKSAPEIPPDRTQTERTQVAQKSFRKKAAGEKHIVCLYLSRDIHSIFPTFIKLIFKTVNGSYVGEMKRKAVPVIYNTIIEKMLMYCCFEEWFFQLEIVFQLPNYYRLQINVPTMGRIHSIPYKP